MLFKLNKFLIDNNFNNEILLECDDSPILNTSKVYFEQYINTKKENESSVFCTEIKSKFKEDYKIDLECRKEDAWAGLGNEHYVLRLISDNINTFREVLKTNSQ